MNFLIINGPNLNLLGLREKEIYGQLSFADYLTKLRDNYTDISLDYFQSNVEGEIINAIHDRGFSCDGIVLNAGAYTHTSLAIADAIAAVSAPAVEVHISNIFQREDFRHVSMIASQCVGTVAGFGLDSYRLALEGLLRYNSEQIEKNK